MDQPAVRRSLQDWAHYFADIAEAAKGTAMKYKASRDEHGERSALIRSDVYLAAAQLIESNPDDTMPRAAARLREQGMQFRSVSGPPLFEFEAAAEKHVRARAWQFCATRLDPEMEEFEKSWD